MAGTVELTRLAQEARLVQERDAAELREQLLHLVRKTEALKTLVLDTKDVEQLMQTLQEAGFRGAMNYFGTNSLIPSIGNPI